MDDGTVTEIGIGTDGGTVTEDRIGTDEGIGTDDDGTGRGGLGFVKVAGLFWVTVAGDVVTVSWLLLGRLTVKVPEVVYSGIFSFPGKLLSHFLSALAQEQFPFYCNDSKSSLQMAWQVLLPSPCGFQCAHSEFRNFAS